MKKILALVLALVLVCGSAFAANVTRLHNVNMEDELLNCTLSVEINSDDITDNTVIVSVFDEMTYDTVDVHNLAVGDTIEYVNGDITVETLEEDEWILINGGFVEENGVTLVPNEQGGTYSAMEWEVGAYIMIGQASFFLADEITFSHWQEDEEGSVAQEMNVSTVSPAELKTAIADLFYGTVYAAQTTIRVENGYVVEVTVDYIP